MESQNFEQFYNKNVGTYSLKQKVSAFFNHLKIMFFGKFLYPEKYNNYLESFDKLKKMKAKHNSERSES